jgi:integrase
MIRVRVALAERLIMAYQEGSIRKVKRLAGDTWMLRFRAEAPDGTRKERTLPIGLVCLFPKERDARREAQRLGLLTKINTEAEIGRVQFKSLASFYLEVDFSDDAVRPKSANTIPIVKHYVMDYLVARWGDEIAEDIKPFEIQKWLLSLHKDKGLAWTTVSKIRGIMHRTYKIGILHERVSKNPLLAVETRSKSNYRAIVMTPAQTLAILEKLINPLHYALTLTCAATALRASEILALRWDDVLWEEGRIRISKRWAKGADGETKTVASDGYVPLHPLLAQQLLGWHRQSPHAKGSDFAFPSLTAEGKVPLNACSFVKDHLRIAEASGVQIADGQRFGLHNLRHSLSNWLVNKGKVEPKTVQGLLRHSKIQTTLDLYTQEDCDETRAAQGAFLTAVGFVGGTVQ